MDSKVNFLKLEDYPSGKKLSKIREMTQGKLKILGGLGGQYYLEELKRHLIIICL